MKSKENMLSIFFAIVINNLGDVLFDLFIVWKVTENSQDVLNAVYLMGSSILFRAILAIFIGTLVDRCNKKIMIISANISSALIITSFAFLYEYILDNLWIGIVFILLNDINNEIFGRSYLLLASELFDKETFIKFQAKYTVVNRVVTTIGSVLVGFLMSVLTDSMIFTIDIITFLVSALCIWPIKNTVKNNYNKEVDVSVIRNIGTDLKCMFEEMLHSQFIIKFVLIMFILNLAYGYIPYVLPLKLASEVSSPSLLGGMKSAISIGEIIGLLLVNYKGQRVSMLFKISMLGNACCMISLLFVSNAYILILIFLLYGFLDSITQPLFSYTVTIIDEKNRGKIIGGIDTIILISPSIGMYFISRIMNVNESVGYLCLTGIFLGTFLIVKYSKELNQIEVEKQREGC